MSKSGFGLWEIIIAVGLLALVSIIVIPSYLGFADTSDLGTTVNTIIHSLNQAQSFARSGERDSDWGVRINPGEIIIFKGSSFISYNPAFDKRFFIPDNISISGLTEIVFSKFSGLPQQTGEVTVNSRFEIKTITINAQGAINY